MHVTLHNADGIITSQPASVQNVSLSGRAWPDWAQRVAWAVIGALTLNAAVGVAILAMLMQGVG